MKKSAISLLGIALLVFASGCCCGWPHGGYNSFYGGGGCPGGNCGVGGGGTIIPQGAYIENSSTVQAGLDQQPAPSFASSPTEYQANYQPQPQPNSYYTGYQAPIYNVGYQPTVLLDPLSTY